jgi:hypothetical protein
LRRFFRFLERELEAQVLLVGDHRSLAAFLLAALAGLWPASGAPLARLLHPRRATPSLCAGTAAGWPALLTAGALEPAVEPPRAGAGSGGGAGGGVEEGLLSNGGGGGGGGGGLPVWGEESAWNGSAAAASSHAHPNRNSLRKKLAGESGKGRAIQSEGMERVPRADNWADGGIRRRREEADGGAQQGGRTYPDARL